MSVWSNAIREDDLQGWWISVWVLEDARSARMRYCRKKVSGSFNMELVVKGHVVAKDVVLYTPPSFYCDKVVSRGVVCWFKHQLLLRGARCC